MRGIRIMDDIPLTLWIVVLPMLLVTLLAMPIAWLQARRAAAKSARS